MSLELDTVIDLLEKTSVADGITFAGKKLKLNNENDAKIVTDAIDLCKNMKYLNLEGNTVGVDAAKAIGKALESHPEFTQALWKDMFTGRMKDEIPQALRFLGSGIVLANAYLTELDLSDNAFGPIAMEGLADFLKSSCCYTLQQFKLNNNGLGITGAKLLSRALLELYEKSKTVGSPLSLKVFVAGRNRLEDEGAKVLADVFRVMGSLEEVIMPQNGIYYKGVRALSNAFKQNRNLRVLNLNDNTVGPKGCAALASVLPYLQNLTHINLGDCLIKNSGAKHLAKALSQGHSQLEAVELGFNEIGVRGAIEIISSLKNKSKLMTLCLNGNQFGESGTQQLMLKVAGTLLEKVISVGEDDGNSENEEEDESGNSECSESDEKDSNIFNENGHNISENSIVSDTEVSSTEKVSAADFLRIPNHEHFLALFSNRAEQILNEIKDIPDGDYLESLLDALMKVSSLTASGTPEVEQAALMCSNVLYTELFQWANINNKLTLVNNSLLVHLGLIKSEDKSWKMPYNQDGCKTALQHALLQEYFPEKTREIVNLFLKRKECVPEIINLTT